MEEKRKIKVIKLIYKKFVRGGSSGLKCLSPEVRKVIQSKIESGSEQALDSNIFDGAQQEVVEEMERTFYIKFFESEHYLNYIRSVQSNGEFSDVNSSKPCSGTHSSASSVSGRQGSTGNPGPPGSGPAPSLGLPLEQQSLVEKTSMLGDSNPWGAKSKMTQSRSDSSGGFYSIFLCDYSRALASFVLFNRF